MNIDIIEKGIEENNYIGEMEDLIDMRRTLLFVTLVIYPMPIIAFFISFFITQNRYGYGIAIAMMFLLYGAMPHKPSSPKPVTPRVCHPFSRLTLSIEWIYNRIVSVILAIFSLLYCSRKKIDFDDNMSILTAALIFVAVIALIIIVTGRIYSLLSNKLKKDAVERRSERCTFAVMAHCLGEGYSYSTENFNGVYDSQSLSVRSNTLGRKKYRYSYNGLNYIMFDQGERPGTADMMIRIDPDDPNTYYEDSWEPEAR